MLLRDLYKAIEFVLIHSDGYFFRCKITQKLAFVGRILALSGDAQWINLDLCAMHRTKGFQGFYDDYS